MKISLNWAQRFSNVDLHKKSTKELIQLATERLGGVEGYVELGSRYEHIYVAKVMSIAKHPDADKLRICKIDDNGTAKNVVRDEQGYVQIVCGAPMVEEGWWVGWLAPGATVPSSANAQPFVLAAKELRGEISYGMLGTPQELDVSHDESGLLVIDPKDYPDQTISSGMKFSELLALDDLIIEVENKMFTHRPDCFGILGIARELAGIQDLAFTSPSWYVNEPQFEKQNRLEATLQNDAPELAPRVMMVPLDGVKVQQSPLWMQSYLNRVGIRPINNIVDITNYVMYLTGQPMHAFDYDKLATLSKSDVTLGPRMAREGEEIVLLGNKKVILSKDDIVLATDKQAVDIAGVMGGAESEVDEHTKAVLLTCCSFDMYAVRRMTMRHGLFTDAATRNTKGQPPEQVDRVLAFAMELMASHASAAQAGVVLDDFPKAKEYKQHRYIELTAQFINERLGSKFSDDKIVKLLTNVEFEAHKASGPISVTPPFWRTDIELPEDIVEEVGRLYGFNQLPLTLPTRSIRPIDPDPKLQLKQRIREILARAGANEVLTYSFVHGSLLEKAHQDPQNSYKLRNALSPELQYYRQSLTPSLLERIHPNVKAGYDEFALFELNKTHHKQAGLNEEKVPVELNMVGFTYTNTNKTSTAAYYHVRHYLDYLASSLGLEFSYTAIDSMPELPLVAPFDVARSALVSIKNTDTFLGVLGEYQPEVIRELKLPVKSAGFEVDLEVLVAALQDMAVTNYVPLSRYPSTDQDITLKVKTAVIFSDIENCLKKTLEGTNYQWQLTPTSIYQKDSAKTKNITFHLTLTHLERTLTMQEITKVIDELVSQAQTQLQAEQV